METARGDFCALRAADPEAAIFILSFAFAVFQTNTPSLLPKTLLCINPFQPGEPVAGPRSGRVLGRSLGAR